MLLVSKPRSVWPSRQPLTHQALFWLLQAGGWSAYGLMMLGYALNRESGPQAVFDVLLLIGSGLALTTLYRRIYAHWRALQLTPLRLAAYVLALAVLGVPAWYEPQVLITRWASQLQPSLVQWIPSYTSISFEACWFYGLVLLVWSLLYFGVNGWTSLQFERQRAARAEALAQSARLRALQSQLEPHFLFNTLNGISSLVVEGRTEAATSMIARLSDFLRLAVQTADTPQITVNEEIRFVSQYLDIQKIRFGDRLHFDIELAPEALGALVPTLLLQPLVENAVRHGMLARSGGVSVNILIAVNAGKLTMRVEDDGPGLQVRSPPSSGLGHSNIASRLHELYGATATFGAGRSSSGGAAIDIAIPLRYAAEQPAAALIVVE